MGGALLRAWLKECVIDASGSSVFDPAIDAQLLQTAEESGISVNPPPDQTEASIVVLAIKPQRAGEVMAAYRRLTRGANVVSVMAGASIETIKSLAPEAGGISRMMPNLAAVIGQSATGLYIPPSVDARSREEIASLARAVGDVISLDSEAAIDWSTAIAGSGPAYFFLLVEALGEAGMALGLDEKQSHQLARATAIGAGALLAADARAPKALRQAVTSPGGTTAAALDVFDGDEGALRALVKRATTAAAKRASELSK